MYNLDPLSFNGEELHCYKHTLAAGIAGYDGRGYHDFYTISSICGCGLDSRRAMIVKGQGTVTLIV